MTVQDCLAFVGFLRSPRRTATRRVFRHQYLGLRTLWNYYGLYFSLAFSTQVRGFKPSRSRRNFRAKKILSTPSFGREVKPSVPCRRFATCKRSLNLSGSRNLGKITRHLSRPQFYLSLLGSLASLRTYRHLAAKVGTSKGGGKLWQTNPKNLHRMQCARAIPVTWLGSGSCQPGL